jgi:hypothetical protein
MTDQEHIQELERCIEDLRARLPKHSVPAAMLLQLEALEDELYDLRKQPRNDSSTSATQKQLP